MSPARKRSTAKRRRPLGSPPRKKTAARKTTRRRKTAARKRPRRRRRRRKKTTRRKTAAKKTTRRKPAAAQDGAEEARRSEDDAEEDRRSRRRRRRRPPRRRKTAAQEDDGAQAGREEAFRREEAVTSRSPTFRGRGASAPLPRSRDERARARLRAALGPTSWPPPPSIAPRPPTTSAHRACSSCSSRDDAAGWLRECLRSLAAQTPPPAGRRRGGQRVSPTAPCELLQQALGEGRVIRARGGPSASPAPSRAATDLPAAQAADYLLLVHDDTALAPDAVARLVEAAEGIQGVERVGVVGPKVVDWDDPRVLREVGRSTDRFGHPYTPLQDGELDQGQYDRVLEVLFVSSTARCSCRGRPGSARDRSTSGSTATTTISTSAGGPALAGFRVLMTPLATARHRGRVRARGAPGGAPASQLPLLRASARRSRRC